MAQYLRPDSDITQTNWSGGYGTIDEASYNDADYITGSASANGTAEYGLSNPSGVPALDTGHVVRFRAWQQNNTFQRTLVVSLYQGSTQISAYNSGVAFNLVKGTPTAYNWTLTESEAGNITDYDDLRIRFVSDGSVGAPAKSQSAVYVSWAEVETPDAGAVTHEGQASITTDSELTVAGSIVHATLEGQASIDTSSELTVSGQIAGDQEGEASIETSSELVVTGIVNSYVPTLDCRIWVIPPEDRLLVIEAENRILVVTPLERTLVIEAEDRIFIITREFRIVEASCSGTVLRDLRILFGECTIETSSELIVSGAVI